MQSLSEIRTLLADRGLRPRRRLGQHFLHDQNQLAKLVEAAALEPGDLVLEVGAGTGTLTEALVERGAEVVTCEIDRDLSTIIEDRLGDRVHLIRGDCLARPRRLREDVQAALGDRSFKLVANLPYQIASVLICTLLTDYPQCTGQFVTIQKEVADRLTASPGIKDYGAPSILVQVLARVERVAVLKPTSFWPAPEVSSAMVRIQPRLDHGIDDPAAFGRFLVQLFTKRRKQLGTILAGTRIEWPAGIAPQLRPEALTPQQAVALWRACAA
ncbi:MAG: 16S rRNA (adenine(1518)-N(6)/adenine(1519)-N(6))-dimethyltransferase RsmA [Planctomycetota bacterium]|jgi:16S rRNA (adenine1518-N6/adenine1519-N6)-dimethyltransferase